MFSRAFKITILAIGTLLFLSSCTHVEAKNYIIESYPIEGWVTKYYNTQGKLTYDIRNANYYRVAFYKNGKICCDSLAFDYNIDSTKLFEGYYWSEKPDSFHHLCIWYHSNNSIYKKNNYYEGKPIGKQIEYYDNGNIKLIYSIQNDKYDGEYIKYFSDGNIEEKGMYKQGKLHGEVSIFYSHGRLKEKANYLNGVFHGNYINHYEDGRIKEKKRYNRGKLTGEHIIYHSNGNIFEKKNLTNDILTGQYFEYFFNGLVKTSGTYSNNNKTGTWTYYKEDGYFEQYRNQTFRVGARCRDGSRSNATGRGACSHHGGVAYWITDTQMIRVNHGYRK